MDTDTKEHFDQVISMLGYLLQDASIKYDFETRQATYVEDEETEEEVTTKAELKE